MGKYFVLVLASDMKRFGFMPLFERNFVLRWVMSISSAEKLARSDRFDFAIVSFDPDPQRAIEFCERLKKIQRQISIVFLKSEHVELPENFCADLVLGSEISEQDLATRLLSHLTRQRSA